MKAYYGYTDASGDYFIIIDSELCEGCEKCVDVCPKGVLHMIFNDYDEYVPEVKSECRKNIRILCSSCKSTMQIPPCIKVCPTNPKAITQTW